MRNIYNKIKIMMATVGLIAAPSLASASANLEADDFVGISFWLISMALIAATAFFFMETQRVSGKWKTSLTVSGLVTLVAAVHYFYMRDVWVATGETPLVYRYIDWLITVPLLMVEFYLILRAITNVSGGIFWRLMIGTMVMLVGGLGSMVSGVIWGLLQHPSSRDFFSLNMIGEWPLLYRVSFQF